MKLNHHISGIGLILAGSFSFSVSAGDFSVETEVSSVYVNRGLKTAELTWFPSVEFAEKDFYAGVWAALPLEKKGRPDFFQDEVDFYAGYGWALSDKWALDLGGIYHDIPSGENTNEAYLGLFGELGTLSPSIYLFKDFDTGEAALEAAATLVIPLQGFPFELTGRLGLIDGDTDYSYFGVDLIYPIELSDVASLSFGVHYDDNDFGFGVPDSLLYGSASVRLSF